jgi:hypothetical protein
MNNMKILKNILFTDIYDDNEIMPNKNKIILGISSFWIFNLISLSYYKELYFLSFNLSLISIASPIYWYIYINNSIYHKIDKYLVIILLLYLFINENFIKFISNIFFILPSYLSSSLFCIDNNYKLQLYSHLLFRFFIFKLIYDFINNNINYFLLITFEYLLFNIYLIKDIKYNCDNNLIFYIKYSTKLIIIIGFNDFFYYNIN